jgi:hypothetical protein
VALANARVPVVDLNDVEGVIEIVLRHAAPVESLGATIGPAGQLARKSR